MSSRSLLFFYQQQCDIWLNCCESWVRMGYLQDAQRCYGIAARYARAAIREEMRRNAA